MALLVYKQWHRPPNMKNTPVSNSEHIKYIGERAHAYKDEENGNGLFGKIKDEFQTMLDMKDTQRYVNLLSRKGVTVFRSMISFKPVTVEALGLENKTDWENYVKSHISRIAEGAGIKIENFEYLSTVHLKKGQPHIHFMFWDKNQDVGRSFVNPEIPDNIRKNLLKKTIDGILPEFIPGYVYPTDKFNQSKEQRAVAVKNINDARKNLIKDDLKTLGIYDDFVSEKNRIDTAVDSIADDMLDELENAIYGKSRKTYSYSDELLCEAEGLFRDLPETGSIKYMNLKKYNPDYCGRLDAFIGTLINENPELKNEIDKFYKNNRKYQSYFKNARDKSDSDGDFVKNRVYGKIGNAITQKFLNLRKEINADEWQSNFSVEKPVAGNMENTMLQLIESLAFVFSQMNNGFDEYGDAYRKKGDLSKAAVKDLMYNEADKGGDYER